MMARPQALTRTFLAPSVLGGSAGRGGISSLTLSVRAEERSAAPLPGMLACVCEGSTLPSCPQVPGRKPEVSDQE